MRITRSFRARVALAAVAAAAIVVIAAGAVLFATAGRDERRDLDRRLEGEARALAMMRYADAEGLSLEQSVAYADSASDLPMLEVVGHPVAVNPEPKLAAIARKRGWHVEQWAKAPGADRPYLPIGPRGPHLSRSHS